MGWVDRVEDGFGPSVEPRRRPAGGVVASGDSGAAVAFACPLRVPANAPVEPEYGEPGLAVRYGMGPVPAGHLGAYADGPRPFAATCPCHTRVDPWAPRTRRAAGGGSRAGIWGGYRAKGEEEHWFVWAGGGRGLVYGAWLVWRQRAQIALRLG